MARRFGSSFRGYDPDDMDPDDLPARVETLEREKAELEREVARLRGEVDATRSALPEIEDLHAHLQRLREDYAKRTDALQLLIAAAAREIGERTGVGPPPRPSPPGASPPATPRPVEPEEVEEVEEVEPPTVGPRPGADEEATDEFAPVEEPTEAAPAAGLADADGLSVADEPAAAGGDPGSAEVWRPAVSEPVRGDWTPDQRNPGRSP